MNNKFYVERLAHGPQRYSLIKQQPRDWYIIKADKIKNGILKIGSIRFLENMIGKKIRLKVEVIKK